MIVLEAPLEENDFDELIIKLGPQADTYCEIIEPKNLDGQLIIQALVSITAVTIPAIVSYLVGRKSKGTITLKYKGKVDIKLTAEINKKEISEKKLTDYFISLIEKTENALTNSEPSKTKNESTK